MADPNQKTSAQKLEELLTFNPSKELAGPTVLQEAMKEIREERAKVAKDKTKEQLAKAIELHQSINKADQEWKQKVAKFNKELGKIVNKLNAMAQGVEPPPEEEEKKEE